jgi:hypothetical protein
MISLVAINKTIHGGSIMNIDQIASEALRLSSQDRAILAETIWESLEDPYVLSSDISDEEAIILAKQRDGEIERGDVVPLSHRELMNRLRE